MIILSPRLIAVTAISAFLVAMIHTSGVVPAFAQEQVASTEAPAVERAAAPEPLSDDELQILVARIALYPDELVAVIASASLYPLQIVEAQRFLDDSKSKKDLKPKSTWDGSVVSLLNYPEVVKMMSDDLDWTQMLGEAIANQQQDVLDAVQQLRETAVAEGVIKSDDKVKVVEEEDNIVIQPASPEVVYVPQYAPEMLYEPDYSYAPVSYYPDPYPNYYSPAAPYFAGFVTGVIWGGIVDWNDGIWGGNWGGNNWGNDINIDCKRCFNDNDFSGKLDISHYDLKNIDRSKIKFDKNQFNKLDKTKFKDNIKANDSNRIKNKAADLKKTRPATRPTGGKQLKDVRASTLEGLQKKPGNRAANRPGDKMVKPGQDAGNKIPKPGQGIGNKMDKRPGGDKMVKPGQGANNKLAKTGKDVGRKPDKKPKSANFDRPVGKPRPAARPDIRPKNPSPLGEIGGGRKTRDVSSRGSRSMGGGMKWPSGGGANKKIKRPKGGGGNRGGGRRR